MASETEKGNVHFFISGPGMSDTEDVFSWVNDYLNTGEEALVRLYNCGAKHAVVASAVGYAAEAAALRNEPPLAAPGENPLKRLMKKVMFKLCGWYFEYMRGQQSDFNLRAVNAMGAMLEMQNELRNQLVALRGHGRGGS